MTQTDTTLTDALTRFQTNAGITLLERSSKTPLLVVFLRHFGCTFCREALRDLQERRTEIESTGAQICLIHMSPDEDAQSFFGKYELADVDRVSDPEQSLYKAFELKRGSLWQLFGPANWVRGTAAFFSGHGVGKLQGDGFQLPGVFLLRNGRIERAFRHSAAGSRPDYQDVCTIGSAT